MNCDGIDANRLQRTVSRANWDFFHFRQCIVCTVYDAPKDCILGVQVVCVFVSNEKLRSVRIGASISHAHFGSEKNSDFRGCKKS